MAVPEDTERGAAAVDLDFVVVVVVAAAAPAAEPDEEEGREDAKGRCGLWLANLLDEEGERGRARPGGRRPPTA